jgi:alkane 1-monooxygenase
MIGLTYFPPLWRRVMDHRVLDHYEGDLSRVNIHPRMRERVLAKYGDEPLARRAEDGVRDERSREEQRAEG